MISLLIDIDKFGFVEREKDRNCKTKNNRCGRDALYFVLHYYFPDTFNPQKLNPEQIEKQRIFGFKIPDWSPVFGGVTFNRIPRVLRQYGIKVYANKKLLESGWQYLKSGISNTRTFPFEEMTDTVKELLKAGIPCVIDLPAYEAGLYMNHVLFVYGIDERYLYVIDTWQLPCFEYEKITDDPHKFLMRFSLDKVKERWQKRGVLWYFEKQNMPI